MTATPPPRLSPLLLLLPMLLIFGAVLGVGWYTLSAVNVTLNLDGQSIPARTHQATVKLHAPGIKIW